MRGRLIQRFQARLMQLDTAATAADPDGAGPLESGYDSDFREAVIVPQPGEQLGVSARSEKAAVLIPCQFESDTYEALGQLATGDAPSTDIALVFHFADLEDLGLVDASTGDALVRKGDRLDAILDVDGNLVQAIDDPPGLFVTESRPIGWGINMVRPTRNLLLVRFADRQQGVRA